MDPPALVDHAASLLTAHVVKHGDLNITAPKLAQQMVGFMGSVTPNVLHIATQVLQVWKAKNAEASKGMHHMPALSELPTGGSRQVHNGARPLCTTNRALWRRVSSLHVPLNNTCVSHIQLPWKRTVSLA